MSLLIEKHHLKGIYLARVKLKETDDLYKEHRIRERVVKFLHKEQKRKK